MRRSDVRIGSWVESKSDNELESSASSDSRDESADRISGRLTSKAEEARLSVAAPSTLLPSLELSEIPFIGTMCVLAIKLDSVVTVTRERSSNRVDDVHGEHVP